MKNPIIKRIKQLENTKNRKLEDITFIEGYRNLKHAYNHGWEVEGILYVPQKVKHGDYELIQKCQERGAKVSEVTEKILKNLSRRDGPLGIIATIRWEERYVLETLPLSSNPLILVAEAIEKPGNLGVLVRSASAAGCDAVILTNPLTAFHDPSCIHSSLGSIFTIPFVTTQNKHLFKWLNDKKINPVITSPDGKVNYTEYDFTKPTAIMVGNEHGGTSRALIDNGVTVRIDMHGAMDSLNVSVAGAIFLFEAVRQRSVELTNTQILK